MLFLFMTFFGSLFSLEGAQGSQPNIDYSKLNCVGDKIYFTQDRFVLTDDGILLLLKDCDGTDIVVNLSQLNWDDGGIFVFAEQVIKAAGTCRNGHAIWHRDCGGCGVLYCPARCRCYG